MRKLLPSSEKIRRQTGKAELDSTCGYNGHQMYLIINVLSRAIVWLDLIQVRFTLSHQDANQVDLSASPLPRSNNYTLTLHYSRFKIRF